MVKQGILLICIFVTVTAAIPVANTVDNNRKDGQAVNSNTKAANFVNTDGMKLAGVEYANVNGMVYDDDLYMNIEQGRVVSARYFDNESDRDDDYADIENIPITQEQWSAIENALLDVLPVMEQKVEKKTSVLGKLLLKNLRDNVEMTDGPQYTSVSLTWEDQTGSRIKVDYYNPDDRRFNTVIQLMREAVAPTGDEIIYYDEPELIGIYLGQGDSWSGRNGEFSYQLTPVNGAAGYDNDRNDNVEWYFNAYYGENGESKKLNVKVGYDIWEEAEERCDDLDIEDFPEVYSDRSKEKTDPFATLYFSDEKQITVKPDENTMEAMRIFFDGLVHELN